MPQIVENSENGISETRERLYNGEVEITELGEIAEKFKDTAKGSILIAEVCIYFGQSKLALKALKGYQKEHEQMTKAEEKAIKRAMEIARGKPKILTPEKWDSTYVVDERCL